MIRRRLDGDAENKEHIVKQHVYEVRVDWTGNDGDGTKTYKGYRREHVIACTGKPQIQGSSDPAFRGDPSCYNPKSSWLQACRPVTCFGTCICVR